MRRAVTSIIALCLALAIYGTLVALIIVRLNRMLIVCVLKGTPRSPLPIISIADGQLQVFGHTVPLLAVIGSAAVPPLWWAAANFYDANLRRGREIRGECLHCGRPLKGKRGRCPRCGERFERAPARLPLNPRTPGKKIALGDSVSRVPPIRSL